MRGASLELLSRELGVTAATLTLWQETFEPALVDELKKLCYDCFDVEKALSAASDLKYLREIKAKVSEELARPSDEFVKYFTKKVRSGIMFATTLENFRERVRMAFEHHINDVINARLQGAMQTNTYIATQSVNTDETTASSEKPATLIITTDEEVEGYHIIKSILRDTINPSRIKIRDTLQYCGVVLGDKQNKPICRMFFNAKSTKYIEIIGSDKKLTRHKLQNLYDLYSYADNIKEIVSRYEAEE